MNERSSSVCAYTFARNERLLLPLWLDYYGQVDHIVICDHGTADGSIPDGYEVIDLDGPAFDYIYTNKRLREIQKDLLARFDVVVYADCDEFIVPDPLVWTDLREYIELMEPEYVSCIGYDVMQAEDEGPLDLSAPLLAQRSRMLRTTLYDKPLISRRPLEWVTGTHYASDARGNRLPENRDDDLYLFHLKRADWDVYKERTTVRFGSFTEEHKRAFRRDIQDTIPIPERFIGCL